MTAPTPPDCPSLAQLEAFLRDGTGDADLDQHVESCPECAGQVAAIRANDSMLDKLRGSGLRYDADLRAGGGPARPGAPPRSIPGYEIVDEIHRGAQGVVYRAVQVATKRTVALKVLLAGAFATSRQRRRFEREVDLVAALRHPSIVTIYDSGVTEDGQYWFAMEHVDGETLKEHLDRHAELSLEDVLALFRQLCAALQYAHHRGVIHRDLKPGNIMVDRSGRVQVVDFGLAKPIDPEVTLGQASMTREGSFMGTVAYAAPEQTRGDADVRSDVYALGVILYEILTGQYPYAVEGSLSEVLDTIAHAAPRPPTSCLPPRYRVDRDLETIVLKTLSKEPERRYQSAEAMEHDVERYTRGEAIDARRDSAWYVWRKSVARHKMPVFAAALFLALLVGSTIAMYVLYERARRETEKLAEINIFLEDTLGSVEGHGGQADVSVFEMLEEGEQWVGLVLADRPEVESAVRTILGNGYRNLGRGDAADRQLQKALDLRVEHFGADHPEVATSLNSIGLLRLHQGRLAEAQDCFERALVIRRRRFGEKHMAVAWNLGNLARVRRAAGDLDGAESFVRQSIDVRLAVRGERHPDVAMGWFLLGGIMAERGDLQEAIRLHEQALSMRRELLPATHPDLPRSLLELGRLLVGVGEARRAEPLLRECVELRRAMRGDGHWRVGEARSALGACLADAGRRDEAETELVAAYELLAQTVGPEHDETLLALERLAAIGWSPTQGVPP